MPLNEKKNTFEEIQDSQTNKFDKIKSKQDKSLLFFYQSNFEVYIRKQSKFKGDIMISLALRITEVPL